MDPYVYPGQELEIFENASRWKAYFESRISPYIQGNVLEVGAGIGSTAKVLNKGTASSWTLLEPDEILFKKLRASLPSLPPNSILQKGGISDANGEFNTILYIDVLEHIEYDKQELENASGKLSKDGYLIVLSPAFQYLFNEFDKAIGHFRRYNKSMIKKIGPQDLSILSLNYLDSLGYFASLMNSIMLKQSYPTKKQVEIWDKKMIPISRFIDPLIGYSFGKSIIAVWKKQ